MESLSSFAKSPAVLTTLAVGVGAAAIYYYTASASAGKVKSKKRVVVVGGGLAGSFIARALQDEAEVTLVDQKDYMEIPYAIPRCIVEPRVATRSCIAHADYLTSGTLVKSKAVAVFNDAVETEDGTEHHFDILVLAVGKLLPKDAAPYHLSATREEQIKWYAEQHKALAGAESVLVVGGGPVGVELAAEIVTDYPTKKVTLVELGPRLLQFIGEAASACAQSWLEEKGVTVVLNDRVDFGKAPPPAAEGDDGAAPAYMTKGGQGIAADVIYLSVGAKPGTAFLRRGSLGYALDDKGALNVEEDLRVVGTTNVFAVGDCTAIQEAKQGYLASMHAEVALSNIRALLKGEPLPSTYQAPKEKDMLAIVSLGRNDGLLTPPNGKVVTGLLPTVLKSKGLFIDKVRGDLRLYWPELASPLVGLSLSFGRGFLPSILLRYLPA